MWRLSIRSPATIEKSTMNFNNLSVRSKLTYSFALMLILMLSVATTGYMGMRTSNEELHKIVEINVKKIFLLNEMSSSVHIVSRVIRSIALLHDENEIAAQKLKIVDARKQYDEAFSSLEAMPLNEKGKEFVQELKVTSGESRAANNKVLEFAKTDLEGAIKLMMTDGLVSMNKWQKLLLDFTELQMAKNAAEEVSVEEKYQASLLFMAILAGVALASGGFISWYLSRSILGQIGCEPDVAIGIAQKIAEGDLTVRTNCSSGDTTSLLHSIEVMRAGLSEIVIQVQTASDSISVSSKQITNGNMDLSSRTEHQASTLEETASSMEELTSTVKHNADNAQQANILSKSASNVATKGGEVVNQVITTMDSITTSSHKIVDIISVIDGIAFQTNILALNAAVEAARAGEQGRGFAVVASEVRNLAQRSASAAKEVKTLIDDSVEKVEFGSKLVNQAGVTMEEVVNSVKQVTNIISEIAAASKEQNAGIEQINQAVIAMDDVTQQNAALVEEAAAASQSLQDQVSGLVESVGFFRVNHSTMAPTKQAYATSKPKNQTREPASVEPKRIAAASGRKSVVPRVATPRVSAPKQAVAEKDWEEF